MPRRRKSASCSARGSAAASPESGQPARNSRSSARSASWRGPYSRSTSPPPERGLALAMHLGRPEEGAVEDRALEPDLDVALPGEADAAVELHDLARRLERRVGDVRLRDRGRAPGVVEVVLRVGRVPDQ